MGGSSQKPDSFPSTLHNFMCKNSCAPCHIFIANQFIISLLNSNISTPLRSDYQPCWWKYRNLYIQQPRLVVVMTVCKIWCTVNVIRELDAIKIQITPATTCTKCVIEIPSGEYMCRQTHSPTQEYTPTQEVKVMQDTSSLIVQYKPAVMFCIKIIYHVRKIN